MKHHETRLDWREWRRRRAWALKQHGWKQKDIAEALGVTPGAVSQCCTRARLGGVEALRRRRASGRPPELTPQQVRHVASALGSRGRSLRVSRPGLDNQAGLPSDRAAVWGPVSSGPRESALACGGLECAAADPAGDSTRRSRDQSLAGRALARAQKKAAEEKRTIVWIDQSGFYLLPMAVRTYAPRGQTPVLRVKLTRGHLAAISGITPDGRLFMQVQDHAYQSEDVVRFLRLLLRKITGKLLVIWDGAPIHRGQAIKAFLARRAAKRRQLLQLPGYAPELNPDEGIWNLLKRVELKNVCCRDLTELATVVRQAKDRLRHKPMLIRGCVRQCGCEVDSSGGAQRKGIND